jgi:recombination protein RecT
MSTASVEKPQAELATKPRTIQEMLRLDGVKHQIAQALPRHCTADRFLRVVANSVRRVPKLAECDQTSFFNALLTLSQYGLEPDGRNAHLIPFRNNKLNITECQLIIDYKGLVELAMRSGLVSTIHADTVCENDEFEYDRGEITKHRIDLRNRGECYAVYALVKFKDGATKCEVMTRQDIEAIRKRSRAGNSGPWCTDWNEMAKKTVFRRLSKWISISAEFRDAVDADDDTIDLSRTSELVDDRPKADRLADKLIGTPKPDAIDLNEQNSVYSSLYQRIMAGPSRTDGAAILADITAAKNDGAITALEEVELTQQLNREME